MLASKEDHGVETFRSISRMSGFRDETTSGVTSIQGKFLAVSWSDFGAGFPVKLEIPDTEIDRMSGATLLIYKCTILFLLYQLYIVSFCNFCFFLQQICEAEPSC